MIICASFPLAHYLVRMPQPDGVLTVGLIASIFMFLIGEFLAVYSPSRGRSADVEVGLITSAWVLTFMAVFPAVTLSGAFPEFSKTVFSIWFWTTGLLLLCCHMTVRGIMDAMTRAGYFVRKAGIVGFNRLGVEIANNALRSGDCGLQVTGIYDDRTDKRMQETLECPVPIKGGTQDLIEAVQRGAIDTVLIALPMRAEKRIQGMLDALANSTVSVYIVPDFFVFELLHARWTHVGKFPVVSVFESPIYGVDGWLKRGLDLALSCIALIMAAPILLVCGAMIRCTSPGPIFFRQRRYGLDGKEILVWKFRTMTTCDNGPVVQQATKNDPRVTPVGRFLRRTSLDELPQLFNVIAGSMSLVGPRPHATAHNEYYRSLIRGYMMRHKVKPGITGLAQVVGSRGETDTLEKMEARVELDHRYIREWSLMLDVRILFKTIGVVLRQDAY